MSTDVQLDAAVRWQRFIVVLTVPRDAGDDPLAPRPVPEIEGIAVAWVADRVVVGARIDAENEAAAGKAVAALLLGPVPGTTADVLARAGQPMPMSLSISAISPAAPTK